MVLARLLTPEEYGLYGMVVVFTGLGYVLGDMGLGSAAVQAKQISDQQRSNLYWVNVLLGMIVAAGLAVAAGPISAFYSEARLYLIVYVLGLVFLIQGATTQFTANATRDQRFLLLSVGDVLSQVVGLAVAILLALNGFGVWALVWQQVATALTLFAIYGGFGHWVPQFPRRAPMRSLLSFGLSTFGVQLLSFITAKADSLLIGRFFGAAALGIYDRAYQVNQIPTQQLAAPLTRVALPVLSKMQDSVEDLQRHAKTIATFMAYVLGGLILVIGANAAGVVEIVLGKQWAAAAPLLSLLSWGGFFQAVGYVYFWSFLALAATGLQLRFSLITRPFMILLVAGGAFWGPTGVAIGVSTGLIANWIVLTVFALPKAGVRSGPLASLILRAFAGWTVSAYGSALLTHALLPGASALFSLALSVLGAGLLLLVFCIFTPFRKDIVCMASFLRLRR